MIRASKSSPAQPRRNNSSRGDRVKKEIQLEIARVLFIRHRRLFQTAADVLQIPLGTVQSRIARAKIHLFQLLTETNTPPRHSK